MTAAPIRIVSARLPDTGLGREAGFRDDAELVAVAKAERAALKPQVREILDELDALFEYRVLFGVSR